MTLLPFVVVPTGPGPVLGWAVGIAVLLWRGPIRNHSHWLMICSAWVVAGIIGPIWFRGTAFHLGMIGLSVVGLVLLAVSASWSSWTVVLVAALLSVGGLAWSITHDPGDYLDVALMHRAGSEALWEGASPWEGLKVPSGVPDGPPDSTVSGSPYPPPTLIWYSVADWVTDDPRTGGALSWLVLVGACILGRWADPRPVVLILTSAALPLMLWSGWTEMLSVALLVLAVALWQRKALSGVLLGVTLATKQYLVVFTPLLLSRSWRIPPVRRLLPITVAAAVALSGFALGSGYLDAIIGAYGEFAPRTDSASLYGLARALGISLTIPFWLGPVLGAAWAIHAATTRRINDLASFLTEGAKALTILFLFGTQAFANYWYLVVTLLLLACSVELQGGDSDLDHTEAAVAAGR